jgi:hypothetical protein
MTWNLTDLVEGADGAKKMIAAAGVGRTRDVFRCDALRMFELRVTDMSLQLELNCLVLGADISSIFPVKIANTESVGTFKELIKDKKRPAFDHVPADTLKLWKVRAHFLHQLTLMRAFTYDAVGGH